MKISAVSKNNITNANNKANPSFRGVSDALVGFWQFVDNGGRAIQFTVEDMCGTNIPRTIKGATAGYKYTGKINWAALTQEALREFLTGPTMCITPLLITVAAKNAIGRTSNTHIENIKNLSYIMSTLEKKSSKKSLDKDFIEAVAIDMIKKTTGKEEINSEDVKELTSRILGYKRLSDKGKKVFGLIKKSSKAEKESLADIEKTFEYIIKKNKDSFEDTNFLTAKYSISPTKIGATKTKNYVEYAVNYVNDFKNAIKNENSYFTADMVKNFRTTWLGRRLAIIVSMIGVTGFAMSFIPKIYTKFSGNVNPNAKVIYNEADKLPSSPRKEVKA